MTLVWRVQAGFAAALEVWKVAGRTLKLNPSLNLDAGAADEACTDLATKAAITGLPQLKTHEAKVQVALPVFRGKRPGRSSCLKISFCWVRFKAL